MECIFCKIISGEIPSNILEKDEHLIVIDDLHPKAPQHKLIIPRKHIATLNDLTEKDIPLMGHMAYMAQAMAKKLGIDEIGYRTIINCNAGGGQMIFHIHMHLLGGRSMNWPPG